MLLNLFLAILLKFITDPENDLGGQDDEECKDTHDISLPKAPV